MRLRFFFHLLGAIGISIPSQSATILTRSSVADSFLHYGTNGNANYGSDGNLLVKNSSGDSFSRVTVVRFDLAGISGDMIQSADLRLFVSTYNNGTIANTAPVQVFGFADGSTNESFVEATVTRNNFSGLANNSTLFDPTSPQFYFGAGSSAQLLGTFLMGNPAGAIGTTRTITDGAFLEFLRLNAGGVASLFIKRTDSTTSSINVGFASRENSTYAGPALLLTVPEPSKVAFLLAGGLLFVRRRRR
jgi:hypothetical protein